MMRLEMKRAAYSREMRKLLVDFAEDVAPIGGGRVYLPGILTVIRKEFRVGFDSILNDLLMNQILLAYRDVKRTGLIVPSREAWFKDFLSKFKSKPFMGKNLRQRIQAASSNLVKQLKEGVRYKDDPEVVNSRIVGILSGKTTGYSGVSPYNWSKRLLMGEAKRAYWDAYVGLSASGDALVEWVLNPGCVHCRVCLAYSQEGSPALTGLDLGYRPGVYRASMFPDSPHPWCGCFPRIYSQGIDK